MNDPPSLGYGAAGEAQTQTRKRIILFPFSRLLASLAVILFSPRLILPKEAFSAFKEAFMQRSVFLADERGEFLQLSALFRVQACRHFHNHARE